MDYETKRDSIMPSRFIAPGRRFRLRSEVGYNTVDIGTHDILIQRPRKLTEEEKKLWPDREVMVDHILIHFPQAVLEEPYSIKAGCFTSSKAKNLKKRKGT